MKNKEQIIGVLVGVAITIAASIMGLQADAIKDSVCGVQQVEAK